MIRGELTLAEEVTAAPTSICPFITDISRNNYPLVCSMGQNPESGSCPQGIRRDGGPNIKNVLDVLDNLEVLDPFQTIFSQERAVPLRVIDDQLSQIMFHLQHDRS